MKKRLLLFLMAILLLTSSVSVKPIEAKAAATTVVSTSALVKAIFFLLALFGISANVVMTDFKDANVSAFTSWLNNRDPDLYRQFMLVANAVASGATVYNLRREFVERMNQAAAEYFGTDTSVSTAVGSTSFNIAMLSFTPNGTQRYYDQYYGWIYSRNYSSSGYSCIPILFQTAGDLQYYLFFLNADKSARYFVIPFNGGTSVTGISINGATDYTWIYPVNMAYGTNFSLFNSKVVTTDIRTTIQKFVNDYLSGRLTSVESDLTMRPLQTVGNVAATSADATLVGSGQTISQDEDDEIVIDGDTTIDLSNVNIDDWLKQIAEGTLTYSQALQEIGVAAVNTQTMTLEEVQAIAQALNPAAANTDRITGNYTVALSDLFPFCIPFDLYNIISCFKADPVAPSAEITIPVGYDGTEFTWETYTVSLSAFDAVAAVVRVLEYIGFVIALMLITRKLIEG